MQGSANLNLMIKAARKAGRSLVKDFREVENLQASMKGPGDFVSRADLAAEKILRDELMGGRPTYGWCAEESDAVAGEDPTRRWIVDPLDGTSNFLHGLPHWAISVALEHKREIVAALVYDPAKDEMFIAEKGQGAWMNDQRIRVSGRKAMIECLFGTGIPFGGKPELPDTLQDLARLSPACAGVRRWGGCGAGSGLCRRRAAGWLLGARLAALGYRRRSAAGARSRGLCRSDPAGRGYSGARGCFGGQRPGL